MAIRKIITKFVERTSKRRTKQETEAPKPQPKCIKSETIYELRKEWNVVVGAEDYGLYWATKSYYDNGASYVYVFCGTTVRHEMFPVEENGVKVRGDKEWAQRIAEHYNIPVPEEVYRKESSAEKASGGES